jgi:exodeoxyribonuclease VII large subunit
MPDFVAERPLPPVISVAELNRLAKDSIERALPLCWVGGEISNFKRYESGHCYFTLKDAQAQVDCVLFRHRAQLLGWQPQDGTRVEVRAQPTLYETRGKFQLNVESMRRAGLGALYEAFEKLKARLEQEGLFDAARKRSLPPFPRQVGVVTSPQAAALRDVLTTLRRRMPSLPVIVYPTPVQGEGAGARIAAAIALAGERRECDVVIVCRGGGGIEDLWAFNEEVVARAIRACPLPVVSGIGHETDFTIADFAADVRAPTPTGAAELTVPSQAELRQLLIHVSQRLARVGRRGLEDRMQRLDYLSRRVVHPGERIRNRQGELSHLASRLRAAGRRELEAGGWQLHAMGLRMRGVIPDVVGLFRVQEDLARRLRESGRRALETAAGLLGRLDAHVKHLDPHQVLERGYSITQAADGTIVRSAAQLKAGENVKITLARGWADARVKRTGR